MTKTSGGKVKEPTDVLYRIKRGLCGYFSYLAACDMNESFSEYLLYEPILRILTSRGYRVECEVECPGVKQSTAGDRKRLDFQAQRDGVNFALEVKWAKQRSPDISKDLAKLMGYREATNGLAFLCVFGRNSVLSGLDLKSKQLIQKGGLITADLGKTRYSCRVYQLLH